MIEQSYIAIISDFETFKDLIIKQYGNKNIRFFEKEAFLIEDGKSVIAEAYIAENSTKYIVINAKRFENEAQNSLLKVLEEPPRNIVFILAVFSKNLLLDTIKSRLIIKNFSTKQELVKTGLNFKKLSLKNIMDFIDVKISLEKVDKFSKTDLKNLISSIVQECIEQGIKFELKDFEYINKLMILADLNTKSHAILTPLLLMIGDKT